MPSFDSDGSKERGNECADRSSKGSSPSDGSKPALASNDNPSNVAAGVGKRSSRVVSFSHSIPEQSRQLASQPLMIKRSY